MEDGWGVGGGKALRVMRSEVSGENAVTDNSAHAARKVGLTADGFAPWGREVSHRFSRDEQ